MAKVMAITHLLPASLFPVIVMMIVLLLGLGANAETIKIGLMGSYTNSSAIYHAEPAFSIDYDLHYGIQAALSQAVKWGRLPTGDDFQLIVRNISATPGSGMPEAMDLIHNELVLATAGVYTNGASSALMVGKNTTPPTPTLGSISSDLVSFYQEPLAAVNYRMSFADENIALLNIAVNSKLRCQKFFLVFDSTEAGSASFTTVKADFVSLLTGQGLTDWQETSFNSSSISAPSSSMALHMAAMAVAETVMGNSLSLPTCVMDFAKADFNLALAKAIVSHANFGNDTYVLAPSVATLPDAFFPEALRGFTFFVQQFPHPDDTTWLAVERYHAAMADLQSKGGFQPNLTDWSNNNSTLSIYSPDSAHLSYYSLEGYMVGRVLVEIFARMQKPYSRAKVTELVYATSLFVLDDVNVGRYTEKCVGKRADSSSTDAHAGHRRAMDHSTMTTATASDSCTCNAGNKLLFTSYLNSTGSLAQYVTEISENRLVNQMEKVIGSCAFSTSSVLAPTIFLMPIDTAYAKARFNFTEEGASAMHTASPPTTTTPMPMGHSHRREQQRRMQPMSTMNMTMNSSSHMSMTGSNNMNMAMGSTSGGSGGMAHHTHMAMGGSSSASTSSSTTTHASAASAYHQFIQDVNEYTTFAVTTLQHISGNHVEHQSQLAATGDMVPLLHLGENFGTTVDEIPGTPAPTMAASGHSGHSTPAPTPAPTMAASGHSGHSGHRRRSTGHTTNATNNAHVEPSTLEDLYRRYKVTAVAAGFHNFTQSPRPDIVMLDQNPGGIYPLEDPHVTEFKRNRIHTDAVLADYVMATVQHFHSELMPFIIGGYKITVIAETSEELLLVRKSLWTLQYPGFAEYVVSDMTSLDSWLSTQFGTVTQQQVVFVASQVFSSVKSTLQFAAANSGTVQLHIASSEEVVDAAVDSLDHTAKMSWTKDNVFYASTYEAFWTPSVRPIHQSITSNFYDTLAMLKSGGQDDGVATWPKLRAFRMGVILFTAQYAIRSSAVTSQEFVDIWYTQGTLSVFGEPLGLFDDTTCSAAVNFSNAPDRFCQCNKGPRHFYLHSARDWARKAPAANLTGTYVYQMTTCGVHYSDLESSSASLDLALLLGGGGGVLLLLLIVVVAGAAALAPSQRNVAAAPKDQGKPFTIAFTDIQSSTSLWARIPEKMAEAVDTHHRIIRKLIKKFNGYEVKTIGDSFMVAFSDPQDAVAFSGALQAQFYEQDWGHKEIDDVYQQLAEEKATELAAEEADMGETSIVSFGSSRSDNSPTLEVSFGKRPEEMRASDPTLWNGLRVRVGIHHGHGEIRFDKISLGYDYYGIVVNTAARVEAVGNGGQVLITAAVFDEITSRGEFPEGVTTTNLGPQPLRGLDVPVTLYQVCSSGLIKREFAALRLDIERTDLEEDESSGTGSTASRNSAGGGHGGDAHNITPELLAERYARRVKGDRSSQAVYHQLLEQYTFAKVMFSTSSDKKKKEALENWASKWRVTLKKSQDKKMTPKLQWERHLMQLIIRVDPTVDATKKQEQRRQHSVLVPVNSSGSTNPMSETNDSPTFILPMLGPNNPLVSSPVSVTSSISHTSFQSTNGDDPTAATAAIHGEDQGDQKNNCTLVTEDSPGDVFVNIHPAQVSSEVRKLE